MYKLLFILLLGICNFSVTALAQNPNVEEVITKLSLKKWQWMAEKDVDKLSSLFDDDSRFVHMSGTWGKDRELEIIESGSIWYKNAKVHDSVVKIFGSTVIVWNRITLSAVVRGNEVSNEFTVTARCIKTMMIHGNCWI